MKWCNKCKDEYEDYVDRCADCGNELIPYPDSEDEIDDKITSIKSKLRFLSTANSSIEADILLSLLNASGIYTDIRRKGSGAYLNIAYGINYQGTDIYVNEEDYIEARDILDAKPSNFEEESDVKEIRVGVGSMKSEEQRFLNKRRTRMRLVILATMVIPMLLIFLNWIYDLLLKT